MFNNEILFRGSEYTPAIKLARVSPALSSSTSSSTSNAAATIDKAQAAQSSAARPPPSTALEKALGNVSAHVQISQRSLHFSVDKESGKPIVRIVDTETHELIRQIPSEELLAIEERLRSTTGVLLSEQV